MRSLAIFLLCIVSSLCASSPLEQLQQDLPADEYQQVYQQCEMLCLLMQTMPPPQRTLMEKEITDLLDKSINNRSASNLCSQLRLLEEHKVIPGAFTHPSSMYWHQQPGMMPFHMLPNNDYFTPVWRALAVIAVGGIAYLAVKWIKHREAGKALARRDFAPNRQAADDDFVNKFAENAAHLLTRRRR